jgi:hypothetical protein
MKNNPNMDSACAAKAGESLVADASSGNPGGFVISLHFELMWGFEIQELFPNTELIF